MKYFLLCLLLFGCAEPKTKLSNENEVDKMARLCYDNIDLAFRNGILSTQIVIIRNPNLLYVSHDSLVALARQLNPAYLKSWESK